MNIVDSSAWLEYIADTKRAPLFAKIIEDTEHLIIPSVVVYEVYKKVSQERGETVAVEVMQIMRGAKIVDIDQWLAILASQISTGEKLGMADAMIYASALLNDATLYTQDSDFKGLPRVEYFQKG